MNITPIEGVVENGQIRLLQSVTLPENTKVFVVVRDSGPRSPIHIQSPRLANPEQARDFEKQVSQVSADAQL